MNILLCSFAMPSGGHYKVFSVGKRKRRMGRDDHLVDLLKDGLNMAADHVKNFQDTDFDAEVLNSDVPVLVDFWAPWCAPCRAIAPAVEELAKVYEGKVKVGKMNVDDNQGTPARYGVRGIPTLILFRNGQAVDQVVGGVPKARIEDMLKGVL